MEEFGLGDCKSKGHEEFTGEHMTGTSIMAVAFDKGVVIGADSRTTTGSYIANRTTDKLTPLYGNIFCCRSGSAADTQAVAGYASYYLDMHSSEIGGEPDVATAANLVRMICYENKDNLLAGMIVAGWDKKDGGSVYSIPLGGTLMRQDFAIGGSGSTYIYAWCDANYKRGMSKEECQEFVSRALSHAMARDGSSGGVVRLRTITEEGPEDRAFLPGDKLPVLPFADSDVDAFNTKFAEVI